MTRKILIVDDHPVLRRGLASLIESEQGLEVCGEAGNCNTAFIAIEKTQPDLVLVDLALDGSNGLDLVKRMKRCYPKIPSLVLSMHDEELYAERALRAGARGYVSKQQLDESILTAIRQVLAGHVYMSSKVATKLAVKLVADQVSVAESPLDVLSDRELQVFQMIGQGRSTRQIAQDLNLSIKTIESHREHIKHKLSLKSGIELSRRAMLWTEDYLSNRGW